MTHPLFTAIEQKDPKEFKRLLDIELAKPDGVSAVESLEDGGHSLASLAAAAGRLDMLKHLADARVSLVAPMPDQMSPLHHAAARGDQRMVKFLLDRPYLGVNPQARTRMGETAVHLAAEGGHASVMNLLREKGAPMSAATNSGDMAAHYAARGGHVDAIDLLALCASASLMAQNHQGATPAHEAAAADAGAVIARINLKKGAHALTVADNDGNLPQHIAALEGNAAAMGALGNAGVDLTVANREGVAALRVATVHRHQSVVDVLGKFGITPPPAEMGASHWTRVVKDAARALDGRAATPPAKPAPAAQP